MGCTSAKQVSAVPSSEEAQNKGFSNGDLVSDEYKMKAVEKVKYMSGEEGGVDGQDSTVQRRKKERKKERRKKEERKKEIKPKTIIHSSESQQEFFRMLDEKIEKEGREEAREEGRKEGKK
uniref:Uncharacterized protein n=1 Tax=Sphaeramia orbicularis TaxID=375764 RepID=A0A673AE05_9TELE